MLATAIEARADIIEASADVPVIGGAPGENGRAFVFWLAGERLGGRGGDVDCAQVRIGELDVKRVDQIGVECHFSPGRLGFADVVVIAERPMKPGIASWRRSRTIDEVD